MNAQEKSGEELLAWEEVSLLKSRGNIKDTSQSVLVSKKSRDIFQPECCCMDSTEAKRRTISNKADVDKFS